MGKKSDLLLQFITIGFTACLLALIVIKLYPEWYFTKQKAVASEKNNVILKKIINSSSVIEKEVPYEIIIPSANIDLPVAPGVITDDTWTLYDDKVTWLSTSQTPGNGNVIIYGHNRKGLFGSLHTVQIGSAIGVKTNKKVYLYAVSLKKKISPTDVDAILSDNNQLTLYTCDGYLDQWRTLITAEYVGTL